MGLTTGHVPSLHFYCGASVRPDMARATHTSGLHEALAWVAERRRGYPTSTTRTSSSQDAASRPAASGGYEYASGGRGQAASSTSPSSRMSKESRLIWNCWAGLLASEGGHAAADRQLRSDNGRVQPGDVVESGNPTIENSPGPRPGPTRR